MKHLLTAIACCLAVAGSAQTPVAYNPDANGDNYVGSADLVALLAEYGTSYLPLYYNSDAQYVPYTESIGFVVEELASLYVFDCRLVTDGDGSYADIRFEVFGESDYMMPLNGSEFWFINEGTSLSGQITTTHLFSNDDCSGWENHYHGFSFASEYHSGWVEHQPVCAGEYFYSSHNLVLSKMMYLNGEFLTIR